jgi:MSHA biogenesis protein MshQ
MPVETFDTPGDSSWEVPADITSVIVELWGKGGNGATSVGGDNGGGGGGGAYSKKTFVVAPMNTYNYHVSDGTNSGSWFSDASEQFAADGTSASSIDGGAGGDSGSCIGDIVRSGGNGATGNSSPSPDFGGGGGGSATASAVGGNGGTPTAGTGQGNGGAGGSGGDGSNGTIPGGGGGGAGGFDGFTGGTGATGRVKLTYGVVEASGPLFRYGIFEGAVFAAG